MDERAHTESIGDAVAVPRRKGMDAHVHDASRWVLFGLLALSAAAKLLTPHQDAYVVPESLYYLGAVVELAAAVGLHTKYRRWALVTAMVLALVGITLTAAVPGRLCGCFGSLLPLDGSAHVMVSGVLGALACLGLWSKDNGGHRATDPMGSQRPE